MTLSVLAALSSLSLMNWTPGDNLVKHGGLQRRFLLDLPSPSSPKAGLILAFHGYSDSPESHRSYSGLTEAAGRRGFVVAYPEGTLDREGKRFHQVGYQFHEGLRVNDAEFARFLAETLCRDLNLDPKRVFSTGMSNGGDMSFFLACQPRPFVRAIAPIAGTMMSKWAANACTEAEISLLAFNCTEDKTTLYAGDPENKDGWGAYLPLDSIIARWAGPGFGSAKPRRVEAVVKGHSTPTDLFEWRRQTGGRIHFYKALGGSHDWPEMLSGKTTAEAICEFFLRSSS